jgi:hypothetical protein
MTKSWIFRYQRALDAAHIAVVDAIRIGDPELIRQRTEAFEYLRGYYRR